MPNTLSCLGSCAVHMRDRVFCFAQRLRLRQGMRLRAIALALRLGGQARVADRLLAGWKVTLASLSVTGRSMSAGCMSQGLHAASCLLGGSVKCTGHRNAQAYACAQ